MEDFENYTVATLLDNRYKNHFFQDREKRGCFQLLAILLTTITCASVISVFIVKPWSKSWSQQAPNKSQIKRKKKKEGFGPWADSKITWATHPTHPTHNF